MGLNRVNMIDNIRLLQSYRARVSVHILDVSLERMIERIGKNSWVTELLKDVALRLMLEELEIAVWSIYLDRYVWKMKFSLLKEMLYITAYAAKTYLNENKEILIYQAFLSERESRFNYMYNTWVSKVNLAVHPVELNKKFALLRENRFFFNYNACVETMIEEDIEEVLPTVKEVESENLDFQEVPTMLEENLSKPLFIKRHSIEYKPRLVEEIEDTNDHELPTFNKEQSVFSMFFNTQS